MTDDQRAALYAALVAFQGAVPTVAKDRQNPHLRNRYATLESVIETTRPHLAAAGLAVVQEPLDDGDRAGCVTRIVHRDGGELVSTLLMPVGDARGVSRPQAVGIVLSYARRYAWLSVLGLAVGDEDTDGELPQARRAPTASTRSTTPNPTPTPAPAPDRAEEPSRWGASEQRAFFAALREAVGDAPVTYDQIAAWCESVQRPRPSAMTAAQRSALLRHLGTEAGQQAVIAHAARMDAQ